MHATRETQDVDPGIPAGPRRDGQYDQIIAGLRWRITALEGQLAVERDDNKALRQSWADSFADCRF